MAEIQPRFSNNYFLASTVEALKQLNSVLVSALSQAVHAVALEVIKVVQMTYHTSMVCTKILPAAAKAGFEAVPVRMVRRIGNALPSTLGWSAVRYHAGHIAKIARHRRVSPTVISISRPLGISKPNEPTPPVIISDPHNEICLNEARFPLKRAQNVLVACSGLAGLYGLIRIFGEYRSVTTPSTQLFGKTTPKPLPSPSTQLNAAALGMLLPSPSTQLNAAALQTLLPPPSTQLNAAALETLSPSPSTQLNAAALGMLLPSPSTQLNAAALQTLLPPPSTQLFGKATPTPLPFSDNMVSPSLPSFTSLSTIPSFRENVSSSSGQRYSNSSLSATFVGRLLNLSPPALIPPHNVNHIVAADLKPNETILSSPFAELPGTATPTPLPFPGNTVAASLSSFTSLSTTPSFRENVSSSLGQLYSNSSLPETFVGRPLNQSPPALIPPHNVSHIVAADLKPNETIVEDLLTPSFDDTVFKMVLVGGSLLMGGLLLYKYGPNLIRLGRQLGQGYRLNGRANPLGPRDPLPVRLEMPAANGAMRALRYVKRMVERSPVNPVKEQEPLNPRPLPNCYTARSPEEQRKMGGQKPDLVTFNGAVNQKLVYGQVCNLLNLQDDLGEPLVNPVCDLTGQTGALTDLVEHYYVAKNITHFKTNVAVGICPTLVPHLSLRRLISELGQRVKARVPNNEGDPRQLTSDMLAAMDKPKCPISKQPFIDPVIVHTGFSYQGRLFARGETFERVSIPQLARTGDYIYDDVTMKGIMDVLRQPPVSPVNAAEPRASAQMFYAYQGKNAQDKRLMGPQRPNLLPFVPNFQFKRRIYETVCERLGLCDANMQPLLNPVCAKVGPAVNLETAITHYYEYLREGHPLTLEPAGAKPKLTPQLALRRFIAMIGAKVNEAVLYEHCDEDERCAAILALIDVPKCPISGAAFVDPVIVHRQFSHNGTLYPLGETFERNCLPVNFRNNANYIYSDLTMRAVVQNLTNAPANPVIAPEPANIGLPPECYRVLNREDKKAMGPQRPDLVPFESDFDLQDEVYDKVCGHINLRDPILQEPLINPVCDKSGLVGSLDSLVTRYYNLRNATHAVTNELIGNNPKITPHFALRRLITAVREKVKEIVPEEGNDQILRNQVLMAIDMPRCPIGQQPFNEPVIVHKTFMDNRRLFMRGETFERAMIPARYRKQDYIYADVTMRAIKNALLAPPPILPVMPANFTRLPLDHKAIIGRQQLPLSKFAGDEQKTVLYGDVCETLGARGVNLSPLIAPVVNTRGVTGDLESDVELYFINPETRQPQCLVPHLSLRDYLLQIREAVLANNSQEGVLAALPRPVCARTGQPLKEPVIVLKPIQNFVVGKTYESALIPQASRGSVVADQAMVQILNVLHLPNEYLDLSDELKALVGPQQPSLSLFRPAAKEKLYDEVCEALGAQGAISFASFLNPVVNAVGFTDELKESIDWYITNDSNLNPSNNEVVDSKTLVPHLSVRGYMLQIRNAVRTHDDVDAVKAALPKPVCTRTRQTLVNPFVVVKPINGFEVGRTYDAAVIPEASITKGAAVRDQTMVSILTALA